MLKQSQKILIKSFNYSNKRIINNSKIGFKNQLFRNYTTNSIKNSINNNNNNANKFNTFLSIVTILGIGLTISSSSIILNDSASSKKNAKKLISVEEFVKHNKPDDCWVVIHGNVYDMTDFIPKHPGGRAPITINAGKDVTDIFTPIHPPGVIEQYLPKDKFLGKIDGDAPKPEVVLDDDEIERLDNVDNKPSLNKIFNLHDFEYVAKSILPKNAWAYYSSGSDDEIIMRENHYAYQRIYFRPRILEKVGSIDLSTEMLGIKTSVPFYITATALAKLGHPEGEVAIAKAAGKEDVIQMISTFSSCSLDECAEASIEGQSQWYQLYVNTERKVAFDLVKKAENLGMKGIFITVDAPCLGNREKDRKMKFTEDTSIGIGESAERDSGAAAALSSFIDPNLCWDDIKEIKSRSNIPIVIKGVQRVEDVLKAAEYGVNGVVLSNHGGRQLDFAPAPVQLLAEVMPILKRKNLDKNFDVFVDGGVRRGTDILKALCLGAKGVGIGRPILYSLSGYGEEGVRKAIHILKDELELDMRLLGAKNIGELNPNFVDTRNLIGRYAPDSLYGQVYTPLDFVKFKNE
ncbi:oxidoreductase activity protein [[Candida] boidinii]|nr:oxidoreductase activity protein [[Candida] boidinii]OWB64067.1 oxidoreductase activity protein [[Candida] boidinii]